MAQPDVDFIQDVMESGGESLNKCYQCATCSVVCELAPENRPFPRKEMIWAQWGQKERLVSDKHVWICHQCNDCSVHCPREARPGDVLAALRFLSIRHYSVPQFMARLVQDPKWLPIAVIIPVLFVLLMLAVDGHLGVLAAPPPGEIHFGEHFLSHLVLNIMFSSAFTLAILLGLVGVARFWKDMNRVEPIPAGKDPGMISAMISAFFELMAHRKFGKCTAAKSRFWDHFGVFWGFSILFIVTGIVVILILIAPETYPIMSLANPLKIAGNIGALLLIGGCLLAIGHRLSDPEKAGQTRYFDWFFLGVILMVGITGTLTEVARFTDGLSWAYWMYFVHLVFVFALLCYLPFSKFAHLLYRYFAVVHSKRTGGYPA
jgi:quinone-modifying oxidoreductase subunit QmoC